MRFSWIVLFLFFVAGCVPSQSQLRLEMDLEQMKRRLAQLEIDKAESQQSNLADGAGLQRQVAELQAGLDTMRVEFHSVSGQFDDLRKNNDDLSQELLQIKDELTMQIDSLSYRLEQLEAATPISAGGSVQADQPAEKKPEPTRKTPEQSYEEALGLVLNGTDFAAGREQLKAFAENNPEHDLYVNALYWIGEALYGEKKFEEAILQFQDVISSHPGHGKAPDALYKQALAFNALGDTQNARATMRKLMESYPGTDQAKAADRYLQN